MTVDRVLHVAPVELADHLAVPGLGLPVAVVGLVVQRRALLDADLPRGRVDDEQSRVRRVARQRVAQRLAVVRRPGHRVAHRRARRRVLGNAPARLRGDADGRRARDRSAVGVAGRVGHLRRTLVQEGHPQMGFAGVTGQTDPQQGRMLGGGRIGQRVPIGVGEKHPHRFLARLLVIGDTAHRERAAVEGRAGRRRRPVCPALPGARPRAVAIPAGDGAHLRLVGCSRLQTRQVERGGGGPQRAAVGRPPCRVRARLGLLPILRLVAGDGAVHVRCSPRHVQGGGGRLAELRAGQRRRARDRLFDRFRSGWGRKNGYGERECRLVAVLVGGGVGHRVFAGGRRRTAEGAGVRGEGQPRGQGRRQAVGQFAVAPLGLGQHGLGDLLAFLKGQRVDRNREGRRQTGLRGRVAFLRRRLGHRHRERLGHRRIHLVVGRDRHRVVLRLGVGRHRPLDLVARVGQSRRQSGHRHRHRVGVRHRDPERCDRLPPLVGLVSGIRDLRRRVRPGLHRIPACRQVGVARRIRCHHRGHVHRHRSGGRRRDPGCIGGP